MLDHKVGCRSHNTGCDGDCDCRSFAELDAALTSTTSKPADDDDDDLEHHCTQCGWSGRSFHACEGVPGGFPDDET